MLEKLSFWHSISRLPSHPPDPRICSGTGQGCGLVLRNLGDPQHSPNFNQRSETRGTSRVSSSRWRAVVIESSIHGKGRAWYKGCTSGHPRLRASRIRIILSLCYQLVLESILHGGILFRIVNCNDPTRFDTSSGTRQVRVIVHGSPHDACRLGAAGQTECSSGCSWMRFYSPNRAHSAPYGPPAGKKCIL